MRQNSEYEEAVKVLKNGLKHHPDYPTAHYILAKCYKELNWIDDSIFELKETLKYDKENISAMELLASLLYKKGELKKALGIYEELVILTPSKRNDFESVIKDIENKLLDKEKIDKKDVEIKDNNIEKENEGKVENSLDEVLEPHVWGDEETLNRNLSYEGPMASVSGVRELSLDAIDIDTSENVKADMNKSQKKEPEKEEISKNSAERTDIDEEQNSVPKTFYTITMAQVYINQKEYAQAREVLTYLERQDPFNDKVKSLLAQLDNTIKEKNTDEKSEKGNSEKELRNKKALKLNELFETLNKNALKENNDQDMVINKKNTDKDQTSSREKTNKKEMDKFKNWLKGL